MGARLGGRPQRAAVVSRGLVASMVSLSDLKLTAIYKAVVRPGLDSGKKRVGFRVFAPTSGAGPPTRGNSSRVVNATRPRNHPHGLGIRFQDDRGMETRCPAKLKSRRNFGKRLSQTAR